MPKAVRANKKNLNYILNYGKLMQFDLSYIEYEIDNPDYINTELEHVFLITDGSPEENNVTFTVFRGPDFFNLWRFVDKEHPRYFREIERV